MEGAQWKTGCDGMWEGKPENILEDVWSEFWNMNRGLWDWQRRSNKINIKNQNMWVLTVCQVPTKWFVNNSTLTTSTSMQGRYYHYYPHLMHKEMEIQEVSGEQNTQMIHVKSQMINIFGLTGNRVSVTITQFCHGNMKTIMEHTLK